MEGEGALDLTRVREEKPGFTGASCSSHGEPGREDEKKERDRERVEREIQREWRRRERGERQTGRGSEIKRLEPGAEMSSPGSGVCLGRW